jgi:hypothetical protein
VMEYSDTVKSLLPKPSEIIVDVQDLTLADYQRAIDYSLRVLKSQSGVCFIGQFGSVKTPGISDIDLIVVARDDDFRSIRERSRRIPEEACNGTYLFCHSIAVLPYSLVRVARVLHSFNNLRILWGNSSILDQLEEPAFPLTFINSIVWNSWFWQAALKLRFRPSLRRLLLFIGNFLKSIAFDYHLLGELRRSHFILKWGEDLRQIILEVPPEQRPDLTVRYLSETLCRWLEADWRVQEWWTRTVRPRSEAPDEFNLPLLGPKIIAQFRQDNMAAHKNRRPLSRLVDERLRRFTGGITLPLPLFYLEVAVSTKSAFEPWLNSPHFEQAARILDLQSLMNSPLRESLLIYKNAVESVRKFSRENGHDELKVYNDISCLPFGTCFKKPVRKKVSIQRLRAAVRKIAPISMWRPFLTGHN